METADPPGAAGLPGMNHIGGYELLGEIGRGGMGIVYRARQRSLGREVALKVILAGEFASETAVARFREEAEAIAHLEHPNIVPIYEIGEAQGRHFFSMKLIVGHSLAQRLHAKHAPGGAATPSPSASVGTPLTPRQAAILLAKVCRAVDFMHQKGILHRDLSPENILLDAEGEPWVADFGLARLVPDGRLTRSFTLLGKPEYMSPEQAETRGAELTPASDIFSLGVLLYELLTGVSPFAAATPLAILERVRQHEPHRPSRSHPAVDRDLDTICLKCLAKAPSDRYRTAGEVAEDLERWVRHEPIRARPLGALERGWKWVRRHRLQAALTGTLVLLAVVPLGLSFYFYRVRMPQLARSHPIIGRDHNLDGFLLAFETGSVGRATVNFDPRFFDASTRQAILCFSNIPPDVLPWVSNLKCQVMADIVLAPDEPRSPVVRHGQPLTIFQASRRDRAYYLRLLDASPEDVLTRAPQARIWITGLGVGD